MKTAPYHESPDGLMRKCSNPPKCQFGTSVANHQMMTQKEAEKANESTTEKQMANEGKEAVHSISRGQTKDERAERHAGGDPRAVESLDLEPSTDYDQEVKSLETRIAGYHEDNVAEAVVSGQKKVDTISRGGRLVHSSDLKDIITSSLDKIDSNGSDVSNVDVAKEYAKRFDKTIAGNGDSVSRARAAKLVLVHAAKSLYSKRTGLQERRSTLIAERKLSLHSSKERRLEEARSQLHESLVSSGLHDYRAGAKEREQQPFDTPYQATDGKVYGAKEVKLPDAMTVTLTSRGFPVQKIYELNSTPEAAELYRNKAMEFKNDNPFHASLTVYDAKEYEGQRIFMSEDGQSGFVLKDTGDGERNEVVTVFSTKSAPKGAAYQMMAQSVGEGGSKLDCYNTVLPSIYSSVGFKEHDYWDWDDEYKPDDWDYDTYSSYNEGRPGVVLMEWSPNYESARSVNDTRSTDERRRS